MSRRYRFSPAASPSLALGPLLLLALLLPALARAQGPLPLLLDSPNPEQGGGFGNAVARVPDVDGDGLDDLLVGASGEDGGAPVAGRVYLHRGTDGAILRTLTSLNPEQGGGFGTAVAGVPDVDGDGRGDLIVGAPSELNAGRAYVFSGATGALLHVVDSLNPESFGEFGAAVAGVPDADGDGRGDLLVGAANESGETPHSGRAYLFSGATGLLFRTLETPNPQGGQFDGGRFGGAVAGVPDVDGDGRGDLLVGARADGLSGGDMGGLAYVFSGATGALLYTLDSAVPENGGFGHSVSGVPDVNGDGRDDFLVGAPQEVDIRRRGRAYVFSGATGALLRALTSPDPEGFGFFGTSVSSVPDADGDGRGDLLVGAEGEDGGENDAGQAHLLSGATGALLRTLTSPNPEGFAFFGRSVAGVADADGDGLGDLLVGAYSEDGGASNAGRAYLYRSGRGVALSASGSPTTIPPGGAVTATATATNNTGQPLTGDLWVVAERGGRDVLTRLVGSGTLPALQTVIRQFTLTAPENTPPGVYTVRVNVGDFPDDALATDAFDVTVTGDALALSASAAEPFVVGALAGDVFAADALSSSSAASPGTAVSPNPFVGQATLRFNLDQPGAVRLSVHDVLGREVARLVDGAVEAGAHAAVFDGRGLAAGVYVWRLVAGASVKTGRLTLLD